MNSLLISMATAISAFGSPNGSWGRIILDQVDYGSPQAQDSAVTRSSSSHPLVEGFSYIGGMKLSKFVNRQVDEKYIGYFYCDLDLYTASFTESSTLVLAHSQTTAVSGYIADQAGRSNYDDDYDLTKLTIYLSAPRLRDTSNDYFTPDVHPIDWWPKSGEDSPVGTFSHNSEFGIGGEFGVDFGGSVGSSGVSIEPGVGASINLTYSSGSSISSADPLFSSAQSTPGEEPYNSYFYMVDYAKYGRIAYTLNTYALFEIAYDAYGFNDYSFVVDYYIDMEVGKNLFAWQDHYEHITYRYRYLFNLGYQPAAENVDLFE